MASTTVSYQAVADAQFGYPFSNFTMINPCSNQAGNFRCQNSIVRTLGPNTVTVEIAAPAFGQWTGQTASSQLCAGGAAWAGCYFTFVFDQDLNAQGQLYSSGNSFDYLALVPDGLQGGAYDIWLQGVGVFMDAGTPRAIEGSSGSYPAITTTPTNGDVYFVYVTVGGVVRYGVNGVTTQTLSTGFNTTNPWRLVSYGFTSGIFRITGFGTMKRPAGFLIPAVSYQAVADTRIGYPFPSLTLYYPCISQSDANCQNANITTLGPQTLTLEIKPIGPWSGHAASNQVCAGGAAWAGCYFTFAYNQDLNAQGQLYPFNGNGDIYLALVPDGLQGGTYDMWLQGVGISIYNGIPKALELGTNLSPAIAGYATFGNVYFVYVTIGGAVHYGVNGVTVQTLTTGFDTTKTWRLVSYGFMPAIFRITGFGTMIPPVGFAVPPAKTQVIANSVTVYPFPNITLYNPCSSPSDYNCYNANVTTLGPQTLTVDIYGDGTGRRTGQTASNQVCVGGAAWGGCYFTFVFDEDLNTKGHLNSSGNGAEAYLALVPDGVQGGSYDIKDQGVGILMDTGIPLVLQFSSGAHPAIATTKSNGDVYFVYVTVSGVVQYGFNGVTTQTLFIGFDTTKTWRLVSYGTGVRSGVFRITGFGTVQALAVPTAAPPTAAPTPTAFSSSLADYSSSTRYSSSPAAYSSSLADYPSSSFSAFSSSLSAFSSSTIVDSSSSIWYSSSIRYSSSTARSTVSSSSYSSSSLAGGGSYSSSAWIVNDTFTPPPTEDASSTTVPSSDSSTSLPLWTSIVAGVAGAISVAVLIATVWVKLCRKPPAVSTKGQAAATHAYSPVHPRHTQEGMMPTSVGELLRSMYALKSPQQ